MIFGACFVLGQSAHAIEKVAREKTLVVTPWSDTTGPLKNAKNWQKRRNIGPGGSQNVPKIAQNLSGKVGKSKKWHPKHEN